MSEWHPVTDYPGGSEPKLFVAVFNKDNPSHVDVLYAKSGKLNSFWTNDGSWMSVNEQGWVPYAWRYADLPERDDAKLPPAWTDYMTETTD